MTNIMDRFFIKAGLPADDLRDMKTRPILYAGILFSTGFALVFTGLAVETIFF